MKRNTQSDPVEFARHIFKRTANMVRLIPSIEHHLLEDQADALAGGGEFGGGSGSGVSDPTAMAVVGPVSSPEALKSSRVTTFAQFAAKRRAIVSALRGVDEALNHLERTCTAAISVKPEAMVNVEPRCPGWSVELQTARVGGCGAIREQYTRDDKTKGTRTLCASCRKAESADRRYRERMAEQHAR